MNKNMLGKSQLFGGKTILLIHGPNLNFLGKRDSGHYGIMSLSNLVLVVEQYAKKLKLNVKGFLSNYEGALIDFLQKNSSKALGIIINAGALTHYSYALHDALLDTKLPTVEVHLSKIEKREKWRRISVIAPACKKVISGKKELGYFEALDYLSNLLNK